MLNTNDALYGRNNKSKGQKKIEIQALIPVGYVEARKVIINDPNHNPVVFRICSDGPWAVVRYSGNSRRSFVLSEGKFQTQEEAEKFADSLPHKQTLYQVYYDGQVLFSSPLQQRALSFERFMKDNYRGTVILKCENVAV